MQPCIRIYYSIVHWRLNMFRAAYRSSSGALTVFAASGLHTLVVTGRSQVWVGTAVPTQTWLRPVTTMNGGIINSNTRLHLVGYFYWVILRCTNPWILNIINIIGRLLYSMNLRFLIKYGSLIKCNKWFFSGSDKLQDCFRVTLLPQDGKFFVLNTDRQWQVLHWWTQNVVDI